MGFHLGSSTGQPEKAIVIKAFVFWGVPDEKDKGISRGRPGLNVRVHLPFN